MIAKLGMEWKCLLVTPMKHVPFVLTACLTQATPLAAASQRIVCFDVAFPSVFANPCPAPPLHVTGGYHRINAQARVLSSSANSLLGLNIFSSFNLFTPLLRDTALLCSRARSLTCVSPMPLSCARCAVLGTERSLPLFCLCIHPPSQPVISEAKQEERPNIGVHDGRCRGHAGFIRDRKFGPCLSVSSHPEHGHPRSSSESGGVNTRLSGRVTKATVTNGMQVKTSHSAHTFKRTGAV